MIKTHDPRCCSSHLSSPNFMDEPCHATTPESLVSKGLLHEIRGSCEGISFGGESCSPVGRNGRWRDCHATSDAWQSPNSKMQYVGDKERIKWFWTPRYVLHCMPGPEEEESGVWPRITTYVVPAKKEDPSRRTGGYKSKIGAVVKKVCPAGLSS